MDKIKKILLSRLFVTGLSIFIQAIFFVYVLLYLSNEFLYIYLGLLFLSLLIVLYIINKNGNPSFKIPWIVLILTVPVLGGFLYLFLGRHSISKESKERWTKIFQKSENFFKQDKKVEESLKKEDSTMYHQAYYVSHYTSSPIYKHTKTKYYPLGDDVFSDIIEDIKNAKQFIFLEFFIIKEGYFLDTILELLKEKVKEGVEVRFMYDDIGSITLDSKSYDETFEKYGIKSVAFNRFSPILSISHNNRDHRKILVIDGKIGYTGGINIADEYINKTVRFGHWKDTCIRLEGLAVNSLSILFLESWDHEKKVETDYTKYQTNYSVPSDGYVIPFGDNPLDDEQTGKEVYMNIINQAEEYLYINTPYLIVDFDIMESLCRASKRGVDVRITLPHIADKWYVHIVTRSFYDTLIASGIKVYEYTPGFLHAKSFVADDKVAVIGTINLDYRSLVHHFECGVWLYNTKTVKDIKDDFLKTQNKCQRINLHDSEQISWFMKWIRSIIKFFAPLM